MFEFLSNLLSVAFGVTLGLMIYDEIQRLRAVAIIKRDEETLQERLKEDNKRWNQSWEDDDDDE